MPKDPCGTSHEMRGELAALIAQGKTRDQIRPVRSSSTTAARNCSARRSTTASTDSRGCCRGRWCGRGGRSWLRRDPLVQESPDGGAGAAAATDPELNERLDDELRNLD